MKSWSIIYFCLITSLVVLPHSLLAQQDSTDVLREIYSQDPSLWPKPTVEDTIEWIELGILPDSPIKDRDDLKDIIDLGKKLFFDPRLSSSGQISCASCHDPELGWSNGRTLAVGHDHLQGNRNTPTLFNVWAVQPLFWDGRAATLEEQSMGPIENPVEMHQNPDELAEKLKEIEGYRPLFEKAFGNEELTKERIQTAIATFERTIVSKKADFDRFLSGNKNAMSDEAIRGLHLFRTKARCMNCHDGPLLTDNGFHNLGLHYYGRKYEDLGLYEITKDPDDVGKFKTPSLRDVIYTGPYMHNGLFPSLEGIMNMYNAGMARPKPRKEFKDDPLFPTTSDILKPLNLTKEEKEELIAFLESISTRPYRMPRPELPK